MEVIQYSPPESWSDKNMNWSEPDPANIDYVMALRCALLERATTVRLTYLPEKIWTIMPYRPLRVDAMNSLRTLLYDLIPCFVNRDFDDYKDDLSDFPKMWTIADLITTERNIAEYPGPGSLITPWQTWIKAMREVINKLTCIKFDAISGTTLSRSGVKHDPPFSESINTALKEAMEGDPDKSTFSYFPQQIYAWSGNTDYWYDKEKGTHGYCGYAMSRSIAISKVMRPHPTADCDLIFKYLISKPKEPVSYSSELQSSTFDSGSTGLQEGIGTLVSHWDSAVENNIQFGDVNDIPKNSTVPSSYWGEDKTIRRSAKTGYEGSVYAIIDFGVEKGFKFQADS